MESKKYKWRFLCLIAGMLIVSSCFSSWTGEETDGTGSITVRMGSSASSRALVDVANDEQDDFVHQITLYSPGRSFGPFTMDFNSATSTLSAAAVPAGSYNRIEIRAMGANPYTLSEPILNGKPAPILRAFGEFIDTFTITNGQTTNISTTVDMYGSVEVNSWEELKEAVMFSRAGVTSSKPEIIFVKQNLTSDFKIEIDRDIIIRGGGVTITRVDDWQASLFKINGSGVKLELQASAEGDFIIDGGSPPAGQEVWSLINVDGGELLINSTGPTNVIIQNNKAFVDNSSGDAQGGAVFVGSSGIFNMFGGIIRNNQVTVSYSASTSGTGRALGGGICVDDGTLTMQDGALIEGNKAISDSLLAYSAYGGGVYFKGGGSFTMSDSKIRDNHALCSDAYVFSACDAQGGGVYITNSDFYMGTDAVIQSNSAVVANDSIFVHNMQGGGVYFIGSGKEFEMNPGSLIDNNEAYYSGSGTAACKVEGGGVYISSPAASAEFKIKGGTISNNKVYGDGSSVCYGGGVYSDDTVTMTGGNIGPGNYADTVGGGIFNNGYFGMYRSATWNFSDPSLEKIAGNLSTFLFSNAHNGLSGNLEIDPPSPPMFYGPGGGW